MAPEFPPKLGEWVPGDPLKREPPLPRWLIRKHDGERKLTLWHGTEAKNAPSIIEKGIRPRTLSECEERVDRVLREYGLSRQEVPEKVWRPSLARCVDRLGQGLSFRSEKVRHGRVSQAGFRTSLP